MPRHRSAAAAIEAVAAAPRTREPELNSAGLLAAAAMEFATHGLKGARMEHIARTAGITRAMIYYYFGGREGLYLATLEEAYHWIRQQEMAVDLEGLPAAEAMRRLVEFRIDFYADNPTFVALVAIENQHEGAFLRQSEVVRGRGAANVARTRAVLERGQAEGVFRRDVDPLDLHQIMVSLGVFNVSNRHTFGLIFGRDLAGKAQVARTRRMATEVVLRYLAA
jgi:TetR/AcrR family transcriptional regulator